VTSHPAALVDPSSVGCRRACSPVDNVALITVALANARKTFALHRHVPISGSACELATE
jgi:hypothetical protein